MKNTSSFAVTAGTAGIDDPRLKASISDLCMALFNSAQEGTISRGTNKPMSMAIVAANFTVHESKK